MADESWLLERISDGLVGWVAFQQAARRTKHFLEHYLYPPILEMAHGRGWVVTPQFPLPRRRRRKGAPETFDFLLFREANGKDENGLAAVEIKFIRNIERNYGIADDVRKLIKVNAEDLGLEGYGSLRRYIVVCGYEKKLRAYFARNIEDNAFARFLQKIEQETSNEKYGWVRKSDARIEGRPMVIVFKNRGWRKVFSNG